MMRLFIRFYSDLIVKVNISDKDMCFDSTTGVKQGCTMLDGLEYARYFEICARDIFCISTKDI
jgi:hypothetical protein